MLTRLLEFWYHRPTIASAILQNSCKKVCQGCWDVQLVSITGLLLRTNLNNNILHFLLFSEFEHFCCDCTTVEFCEMKEENCVETSWPSRICSCPEIFEERVRRIRISSRYLVRIVLVRLQDIRYVSFLAVHNLCRNTRFRVAARTTLESQHSSVCHSTRTHLAIKIK